MHTVQEGSAKVVAISASAYLMALLREGVWGWRRKTLLAEMRLTHFKEAPTLLSPTLAYKTVPPVRNFVSSQTQLLFSLGENILS